MPDHEEDKARLGRKASKDAIALAMQSRWQEAVTANKAIIESFPTDIDTYNRLGRAYMELGEFARAKEAYSRALELDPYNAIAERNLHRLSLLPDAHVPVKEGRRAVAPDLFIGEMGKAGAVNLQNVAPQEILARMTAGNQVYLKVRGQQLTVENEQGEYLGRVEPQYGLRLAKLIEGGNQYAAAILSLDKDKAKVLIREMFQHPSQVGRLSFPVRSVEGFYPHVKDTLLRNAALDEEAMEEEEDVELEEGELLPEGFSIFEGVAPPENEGIEEDMMREE